MFRSGAVDCREPSSVTVAVIVYAVVLILVGAVYWRAIGPERAELTDVRYAGPTNSIGRSSSCIHICPHARQRQYVTIVVRRVAATSSDSHAVQA